MKGLFSWIVAAVSGTAMMTVALGGAIGMFTDSDIRRVTSWSFWYESVIAPIAEFALWVNRETWGHYLVLGVLLFYGVYFLMKWRHLEEELLEETEELGWF